MNRPRPEGEYRDFTVSARDLGRYDVAVAGGGVSGVAAAVTAARRGSRVVLIEGCGCLGGALTSGLVPNMSLDRDGKGGIVAEFFRFMDAHGFTCPRRGPLTDEKGGLIPGGVVSPDGAKICFDRLCAEAGVTVLFHSHVVGVRMDGRKIEELLVGTECGAAVVRAELYVDATGNGNLSLMAGCRGEIGHPDDRHPQPATLGYMMSGLGFSESTVDKAAYGEALAAAGLDLANKRPCALRLPDLHNSLLWTNYEYDVDTRDILGISRAVRHARGEVLETAEAHRRIPGHAGAKLGAVAEHLGIREGYRIAGVYRLTLDDLLRGARFADGVCLASFVVDVHKTTAEGDPHTARRYRVQPYHIPYRALVPLDADDLLLCGRLLSGDFFAHASYRVICNMMAVGEAVGFAAHALVAEKCAPARFDGSRVRAFMEERGYRL
jgi:hypothetical protein